jgi:shikimate dehydrogenase
MPARLEPAAEPTMYFIGVTTGSSSIMRVFPAWAEHLGLDAIIKGIDLPLHADAERYREVVRFIREDPNSLGALVTTHKLDLLKATHDLFDELGDDAALLEEISSISKSDGRLVGHAKDPITSGLSLQAIVPDGYWAESDAELLILGAGGSSLALSLYLHWRHASGVDVPRRVVVTNRSPGRLEEMRAVHDRIGFALSAAYVHAPELSDNDRQLASLPDGSVVINATGLGKDRPGSPLTDDARFPRGGVAWDFNYRGDLLFLEQAQRQRDARALRVIDGWEYFIHGWTRVIAEVFAIDLPTAGPEFERLSEIARTTTSGART